MVNSYLKWTATTATLIGAALTSFRIDPANIYMLNLGAALFLIWSIRIKEHSLISVNLGVLLIYAIGIFIGK